MTLLETANELAERGWYPFPVKVGPDPERPGKFKKTYLCKWKDIDNSEDALDGMSWGEATHVGVNCKLSKVWVIDIDDPASLDRFQPPHTCQQLTQREGGRHYLYQAASFDERNHAGWPIPGQDIRANGGMFVWYGLGGLTDEPLEPWPFKAPLKEPAAAAEPQMDGEWPSTTFGLNVLSMAVRTVLAAEEGRRNDTLNKEAFWVGQVVAGKSLNPKEAANQLFEAALNAGLDRVESRRTIISGMEAGWASPIYEAADQSTMAEEERKPFSRQSMRGFMQSTLLPTEFAVDWWLPRGEVTLISGHGGVGKSFFALLLACYAACGRTIAERAIPVPMRVLYVSLEDRMGVVVHRVQAIVRKHGLDVAMIEENLFVADGSGEAHSALYVEASRDRPMPFTTRYDELLTMAKGMDITLVDNTSEGFMGNENARIQVVQFVRGLRRIAVAHHMALGLLAHIDKVAARGGAEGNNYSGSTAWHNSVRSRLALVNEEGVLCVKHEKHNHSPEAPPVHLEFQDGTICIVSAEDAKAAKEAARESADEAIIEQILIVLEKAPIGLSRTALLKLFRETKGPIYAQEDTGRRLIDEMLGRNLIKSVESKLIHWKKV